jgi:hypothetical protein
MTQGKGFFPSVVILYDLQRKIIRAHERSTASRGVEVY